MAGALLGALVVLVGTFASFRPNRVLLGEPERAVEALGPFAWVLLAAWALVFVLAALPATRRSALVRGLIANGIAVSAVVAAASLSAQFISEQGDSVRVTLGASFWFTLFACYVVGFAALEYLPTRGERAAVMGSAVAVVIGLLATGRLDSLAIMQEYLRDPEAFWTAFSQQVAYTVGATGVALVLGLALGIWAARRPRAEGPIFGVVNVLQVLPTLSFVGLLIAPMSWLGSNVPALDALGVSGIGWAPVFVVLCAYALYPITRNTFSAMKTLDAGVVDAARGIGMRPVQRLAQVELPLAFPIVLVGVRIAAVQTAAGAIIAGLVGGGGLGQIVFLGLQQTATDLMLLGVIPIVALALTIDISLRALQRLASVSPATEEVLAA